MPTLPLSFSYSEEALAQAVETLRAQQLVAFPTETVYGLGAMARSPQAMARLYALKGRPSQHPVIVHLASAESLGAWAATVPPEALLLAEAFWPGPLTLILHKHPSVLDAVTGGKPTVGLRVPQHPLALALLKALSEGSKSGEGVAAPSANRFGRVSPTTAAHVASDFGDQAPFILDGGTCKVGVESSILDLSGQQPTLLRPGGISVSALSDVLGRPVWVPPAPLALTPANSSAPGTLVSHYAPVTPLTQVTAETLKGCSSFKGLAVLAFSPPPQKESVDRPALWLEASPCPQAYTQAFYANLRRLDQAQAQALWVEALPCSSEWQAVADRLSRACAPR